MVAKLKCGSYMWGAKDDAVCNSALACVKKRKEKPKVSEQISALYLWLFFAKESFTQVKKLNKHDVINTDDIPHETQLTNILTTYIFQN